MSKNISEYSLVELKAMAYDNLASIEAYQVSLRNINASIEAYQVSLRNINAEIAKRAEVKPETPKES